ncbi:MAG TPA: adenylyltransferase/cytidyltransferase family protein [Anaerolineaceae bacterium]|jgi:glycerol-3-phosphate cytidylyltransferase|nr:adenylyltransferase/cytidyltransferase family protein [Anaerolineaceae bacterium]
MIIGYTTGVFDLFHVGHVRMLANAKSLCDKLIVGVTTDELVAYKNKRAVIPFAERLEIVRSLKYVNAAVPQDSMDKMEAWKRYHFDLMFVGDDWFNTPAWQKIEVQFKKIGVRVIYFPYTKGTSSTLVNETLMALRNELAEKKSCP